MIYCHLALTHSQGPKPCNMFVFGLPRRRAANNKNDNNNILTTFFSGAVWSHKHTYDNGIFTPKIGLYFIIYNTNIVYA